MRAAVNDEPEAARPAAEREKVMRIVAVRAEVRHAVDRARVLDVPRILRHRARDRRRSTDSSYISCLVALHHRRSFARSGTLGLIGARQQSMRLPTQ